MQISFNQSSTSPWSSPALLNRAATSASADDKSKKNDAATAIAPEEQDNVSVHRPEEAEALALQQHQTVTPPPEVFAEIWKDGVRVGSVYTDGQAKLPSSLGGPPLSGNGPMYARLRAEEISRQVGGEVRYVNMPALQVEQTRMQLRAAYGV